MSELTKAQQNALELDKHISVTAGAGSGKTRILVERFLKIVLLDPRRVHRILAITFTNKAAAEMRERLSEKINSLLKNDPLPPEKQKLLYIRDHLKSAAVSTIHGFCARTLREFPLESGLSPDVSELDDFQSLLLKQKALEEAMDRLNALPADEIRERWLPLLQALGRFGLNEMLEQALSSPYTMRLIEALFQNTGPQEYLRFLNNQWLALLQDALSGVNFSAFLRKVLFILQNDEVADKNEKGRLLKNILEDFKRIHSKDAAAETERYYSFTQLVAMLTNKQGAAYKNLGKIGSNAGWSAACKEELLELSRMCEPFAARLKELSLGPPADENDRLWYELFIRFLELYRIAQEIYTSLKSEAAGLDFEDLQLQTLKLLEENESVRAELLARFDYIMVDEFQDTNELQWQIIRRLAPDTEEPQEKNVFVVGDPKQSIYGFRDADIRVFKAVRRLFARAAGAGDENDYEGNVVFKNSFRFLPRLNAFINFLFSGILQERGQNPFEVDYQPLQAGREVENAGWASLAVLEQSEEEYIAETISSLLRGRKTCFVNEQGTELERPLQYGDIAILLRSRHRLLDVESALRRLDIPFITAKGVGFWQKQEIYDFYHLLRFLNNPDDDFALVGVLRSRLFMLSDGLLYFLAQEEPPHYIGKIRKGLENGRFSAADKETLSYINSLLQKWISCRERMGLDDLLNIIMDDLRLRTQLTAQLNGEQLLANVEKLIELARFFDEGPGSLNEFIAHLDDLIEREMREGEAQINLEDSGTVKIMTIHAAKGLQFPVVFVPFLNSKSKKGHSVYSDASLGMAVKLNREEHLLYRLLRYINRQKEIAEARRVFYVAATRASNYLFLSAKTEQQEIKADTALQWIAESFGAKNIDLLNSGETIEEQDFSLQIVRSFERSAAVDDDLLLLQEGLQKLKAVSEKQAEAARELPAYLQAISAEPGAMVFSATRLMTYLNDPQAYYQRYHLGFFENDYESFASEIYQSDYGLLKGKLIHRFLELHREEADADELIDRLLFEYDIFDLELQAQFRRELKSARQKISNSQCGQKIISATEARNEVSLTMRLAGDYFTGTLDRLYRNSEGLWEVADYKTNNIRAGQVQEAGAKYDWQIKAYALLLSRLYPQQQVFPVTLYFLKPDSEYRKIFDLPQIEEIEAFLIETIAEIKQRFKVSV